MQVFNKSIWVKLEKATYKIEKIFIGTSATPPVSIGRP